jgi:hypothetical protein
MQVGAMGSMGKGLKWRLSVAVGVVGVAARRGFWSRYRKGCV